AHPPRFPRRCRPRPPRPPPPRPSPRRPARRRSRRRRRGRRAAPPRPPPAPPPRPRPPGRRVPRASPPTGSRPPLHRLVTRRRPTVRAGRAAVARPTGRLGPLGGHRQHLLRRRLVGVLDPDVGQEAGHHDPPPAGDGPQGAVPQVGHDA